MTVTSDREAARANNLALMQDYIKRWMTWLGLGNAAGLAAVGGKIVEVMTQPIAPILFPSCWAFALGLVGAAAFAFAGYVHGLVGKEQWETEDPAVEKKMEFWLGASTALGLVAQITAVGGFLVGLFYPLVILSQKYFVLG